MNVDRIREIEIQDLNSCLICYSEENSINLECGHKFCKECLLQLFDLQNFSIENFKCPEYGCEKILTEKSLRLFVDDLDEKSSQLLNQNILFGLSLNEKLITCLNENCKQKLIIWKDADYYTCHSCKVKYCLRCKLIFHNNMTCLEHFQFRQISVSRLKFMKNAVQKLQNQICPCCQVIIEKNRGCNFITCQSKICNGKKYFCYQCGIPLEKKDSTCHYENNDPFNGNCLINLNGKWVMPDQIPPNDIPCPKCLSTDPKIAKIEGNLLFCMSNECSDKVYCKICQIQLDDLNLLKHLGNHQKSSNLFGAMNKLLQFVKFFKQNAK